MDSDSPRSLAGWDRYPANLRRIYPYHDLDIYRQQLEDNALRLFEDNKIDVLLQTSCQTGDNFQPNREVLKDSVTSGQNFDDILLRHLRILGDHYVYLHRAHSWARIRSPKSAICKILTAVEAPPTFLDLINTFGQCSKGYQPSYFGSSTTHVENDLSIHYTVHYIARTSRSDWPWSLRTLGILYKHEKQTKTSIWIILQPTPFTKEMPELSSACSFDSNMKHHIHLFRSAVSTWRSYLNYVNVQIRQAGYDARLDTSTELLRESKLDLSISVSRIQTLQYQCEVVRDAISALKSNIEVLCSLKTFNASIYRARGHEHAEKSRGFSEDVRSLIEQFATYRGLAEDILDHAKQVLILMNVLVNYRHSQAVSSNTTSLERIAQSSKKDDMLLIELARATRKDSGTMKLVAVITMIYLPGTFVATIFSTGFINSTLNNDDPQTISSQRYSYIAVTTGLMIVTLFAAYVMERRAKLKGASMSP